jgi:hypothetical protein
MTIVTAKNTPRVSYTATTDQTAFAIPFEFFAAADIKVYNGTTLLTYDANANAVDEYTLTGTASSGDDAYEFGAGGTVTLGATGISSGAIVTIIRDITIERASDFSPSGTFDITSLNTDLDKIYAKLADIDQQSDRSVKLLDTDSIAATVTLPAKADRASKVMAFDADGVLTTQENVNNVSIADESSDTTCFPLFVTAASGDLPLKSAAGLTFNASTDVLAGTFSGNITGDVTGDVTGTASVATAVTVADESSDTTCFPLFATAATGDLAPKSGSNLAFNSATGALTATSFVGTAPTPTAITVADESSDTSCFPLFVTAATGDLGPKSAAGLTFNSSSDTLTATAFSGPLTGNVTGNASGSSGSCTGLSATATALASARNIGGVSFDGTGNIDLPGVNTAGNQATSGLAATATLAATTTALASARNIGGVSFDGTGNIDLPGVNTSGNQDTSGTAADATVLETARNIGGVSFNGSANIDLPGVNAAGNQNTSGTAAGLSATLVTGSGGTGLTGAVVGKQTIWIPAAAMYPNTTAGCAALAQLELSNGPELKCLDFDASSDENAQFTVAFPKLWALGTVTFQAFWTVSGTNTGTVAWGLSGVAFASDGDQNTAFGTNVVATALAHSGTTADLMVSAESGAVTIAGSPGDNELCYFQIMRDVSADDQSGDARLLGIKLFFTTDALTDA